MRVQPVSNNSIHNVDIVTSKCNINKVNETNPVDIKQNVNTDSVSLGLRDRVNIESTVCGYGFNNNIQNALRNKINIHNNIHNKSTDTTNNATPNNTSTIINNTTNNINNGTIYNPSTNGTNGTSTDNGIHNHGHHRFHRSNIHTHILQVHLDRWQGHSPMVERRFYNRELFSLFIQQQLLKSLF